MLIYVILLSSGCFKVQGHLVPRLNCLESLEGRIIPNKRKLDTVKTLYNVTRYNRIFNKRHKIAGNGSVSIKIPSL